MIKILIGWRFFSFQKNNYKRLDFNLYREKRSNFPLLPPPPWLRAHFDNFWGMAFSRNIRIKGTFFGGKIKRAFPFCVYFLRPFIFQGRFFLRAFFQPFFFGRPLVFRRATFCYFFCSSLDRPWRWSEVLRFFSPIFQNGGFYFFLPLGPHLLHISMGKDTTFIIPFLDTLNAILERCCHERTMWQDIYSDS